MKKESARQRNEKRIAIALFGALLCSTLSCNLLGMRIPEPQESMKPSIEATSPPEKKPITMRPVETAVPVMTLQPIPSPSISASLKVVYTSENNIYLWTEGEVSQLTTSGDAHNPLISPDGEKVAFLRTADEYHLELWAVNADKTNERRLVSIGDLDKIGGGVRDPAAVAINPYRFQWLPGSHILAFNSHQIFLGPGLSLLNDLNLVNTDTNKIQNLFLSGWGGEFAFSPDGSQIAITQPDKIIISNADGSNYRTVMRYEPVITYSEYRFYADPKWTPSSDALYVALPPVDPLAGADQRTEIWRISTDSAPPVQIGGVIAVPFFEQPVFFSPDLERIAIVREIGLPEQNRRELYLASRDGSDERLYAAESPISFLSWSSDSNHFAYSSGINSQTWIGSLSDAPRFFGEGFQDVHSLIWVGSSDFLFWKAVENVFEIHLGSLEGKSILIDRTFGGPPSLSFSK